MHRNHFIANAVLWAAAIIAAAAAGSPPFFSNILLPALAATALLLTWPRTRAARCAPRAAAN